MVELCSSLILPAQFMVDKALAPPDMNRLLRSKTWLTEALVYSQFPWIFAGVLQKMLSVYLLTPNVSLHYIPLSETCTISIPRAVRLVTDITLGDTGRWLVMVNWIPPGGSFILNRWGAFSSGSILAVCPMFGASHLGREPRSHPITSMLPQYHCAVVVESIHLHSRWTKLRSGHGKHMARSLGPEVLTHGRR